MNSLVVTKQLHTDVDAELTKGYEMFRKYLGMDVPEEYKYFAVDAVSFKYAGKHIINLAAASQCFFWFRYLHTELSAYMKDEDSEDEFLEKATLLGDYFFSRFSIYLIPIDSTPLIDRFSDFLKKDAVKVKDKMDLDSLNVFFKNVSEVLDD